MLGINDLPVTIKQVEVSIIDHAFEHGWVLPEPAARRTGHKVAVVGSGPAGLAAAQQLARQGHDVVLFERADRIGGLLRYGIPDFKMHRRLLDRRLDQMQAEGVQFRTSVDVGGALTGEQLRADFDAVCLGRRRHPGPRPCCAGRRSAGRAPRDDVPRATESHRRRRRGRVRRDAGCRGKRVIILGGGDTGADCLGTAHRQGAASVRQFEIAPRPPDSRGAGRPVAAVAEHLPRLGGP